MTDWGFPSAYEHITNIVLVGSNGNGKSSTGNTILGDKMFKSGREAMRFSRVCKMYRAAIQDGPIINVIDTPGSDNYDSSDYLNEEIIKCLTMAKEGIHAVLFVLSVKSRIPQEEESTFKNLQRIFGSKISDYSIVVFTGGDELEEENYTLEDYLRDSCPEFLTRILRLCRGRKVMFNNKTTDKDKKAEQLNQLLAHVADIRKQNGGAPYTDKLRRNIKEVDDKLNEQETNIEARNLTEACIEVMKDTLRMEHERTMNKIMMAHIVENDLKQSAESHKREMHQLKKTLELQHTQTMNMVEIKKVAATNEIDMGQLKEKLLQRSIETINMVEKMVQSALKLSDEAHEREMHQLKNTLQLSDSQTMNMMAQMSAAEHERKRHRQQLPRSYPFPMEFLCNIM